MSKGTARKVSKLLPSGVDRHKFTMRIVSSDVCAACKKQCARGIAYLEKMSRPGAIGRGVPWILTKGKGFN